MAAMQAVDEFMAKGGGTEDAGGEESGPNRGLEPHVDVGGRYPLLWKGSVRSAKQLAVVTRRIANVETWRLRSSVLQKEGVSS